MSGNYYYYEAGEVSFCRSVDKHYGPCPFTGEYGKGVAPGWLQETFATSGDPDVRGLDAELLFRAAHRSTRYSEDPSRCAGCGAPRPVLGWAVAALAESAG